MYDGKKVYGPYTRKQDGRQIVILKTPGSVYDTQTVSYPKYLVETYLNRYLEPNETVDHIDGDFHNNSLNNLRVVSREEHCRSHAKQKEIHIKHCIVCGKEFSTNNNYRKTCGSKSCGGKSAHLNGYNKGNTSIRKSNTYKDNRGILKNIKSIVDNLK